MSAPRVYGIDLGTTYSCIARVDEYAKPVVIQNTEGLQTTPSVVYFESPDNIVAGAAAKAATPIYPQRCVKLVKRHMGNPNWVFDCDGRRYSPQEVSSFILRKVVKDAEVQTGDKITDVVITCPAYFGTDQKEATKQAGIVAGLNVLAIIPEPTAAAIAYGMELEDDQTILVYDLGGGTFDATLIEVKDRAITVLSTGGDDDLGGADWDSTVASYIATRFEEETGIAADRVLSDVEAYQELLGVAEECKQRLTSANSVERRFQFDGERALVSLTREKFDELTSPYLERTVGFTREMIERVKEYGHDTVDKILLVGGSSFMPQVAERLHAAFPIETRMFRPNQAVAEGAAIYGHKCFLENEVRIRIGMATGTEGGGVDLENVDEATRDRAVREVAGEHGLALTGMKRLIDTEITNVASKSFGVIAVDPSGRELGANIILKDTPLPSAATRVFGTFEDGQTQVDVRLVENQRRGDLNEPVPLEDCDVLAERELVFERALPRNAPIEIMFNLTTDGILKVLAKDLTTGRQEEFVYKTEGLMNAEELESSKRRNLAMTVSS